VNYEIEEEDGKKWYINI